MLEAITKDLLLDLKPSGVLKAAVAGVIEHKVLPNCEILLSTYGTIETRPSGRHYELCIATSALMRMAGTTFPKWVDSANEVNLLISPLGDFRIGDIYPISRWPAYIADLRTTLDYLRYGEFFGILGYYREFLGSVFPYGLEADLIHGFNHGSKSASLQAGGRTDRILTITVDHGMECISFAAELLEGHGF